MKNPPHPTPSPANLPGPAPDALPDERKMILRATQERKPDVLVMARHSYKPDGNFITRRLDALVEEFDHMTFGSVSAFLARRVQCPLLIIPTHAE